MNNIARPRMGEYSLAISTLGNGIIIVTYLFRPKSSCAVKKIWLIKVTIYVLF